MEAAEARRIAEVSAGRDLQDITPGDLMVSLEESVREWAEAGSFRLEFDVTPGCLSPGQLATIVIKLQERGYSCDVHRPNGRTVLHIGW